MRSRQRLGAFGLRGRIVGLVLFTTVATLAVAAITLLGPLESSLRHAATNTLRGELCGGGRICNEHVTRRFTTIDPELALDAKIVGNAPTARRLRDQGGDVFHRLEQLLSAVGSQVGAKDVTLVGSFGAAGNGVVVQTWPGPPALAASDNVGDAATAYRTHTARFSLGSLYVGAASAAELVTLRVPPQIDALTPVATGYVVWGVTPLFLSCFLSDAQPPLELIVSARAVLAGAADPVASVAERRLNSNRTGGRFRRSR